MILPIYSAAITCIPPLLKQSLIRVLVACVAGGIVLVRD